MWHFLAAFMARYGKFVGVPGFSQWIWQYCGLYNQFQGWDQKDGAVKSGTEQFKVGQLKPLFRLLFCPFFFCPFWTQSTWDIGYLKLRCLIKALSLTCSTSLTCYIWLLHGCLKKPQKILRYFKIAKYFWFPRLRPFPICPPSPARASGAEGSGEEVGGGWRHWKLTEFELFHQISPGFTRLYKVFSRSFLG